MDPFNQIKINDFYLRKIKLRGKLQIKHLQYVRQLDIFNILRNLHQSFKK